MNLALFDFDGTITTHEMFAPFVRFAVPPGRRMLGNVVFAPIYAGYKLGMVSGSAIRSSVVRFGFSGVAADTMHEAGKRFSNDILPNVVRPHALERMRWHQAQDDTVAVVSGSLDVYLTHWCSQHNVDLICSRLETRDGRLTGRYVGEQCVGEEKAQRVRDRYDLGGFGQLYAYGDTHEDMAMLALAHRKYFRWEEMA
ncbi:HAD-superfamily subfamily IB hydrolase, TIGR01490 [Dyella sp. OK004]|uniref:HAD family hydrolase n=1 Tax=Dyella sp. OK004 TaxID=1855292 RepID=UPI0008E1EEFB|nr:HAD family hydrolase [Dyella sp. OK004]SFR95233.1 HAD-superfamily subfamily IB hydrolase, TIGR01490 [Dyella sp. OK004]